MPDQLPLPPGWGKDWLSDFIQKTHENSFRTFLYLKDFYLRLSKINDVYGLACESLNNSEKGFAGLFLFKSRASFLGACRFSVSIQLAEVYPLLRACLENALYAVAVAEDIKNFEVWLRRHEDEQSRWEVVRAFSPKNLWPLLEKRNGPLASQAKKLYEETIDYGGHPNERSLTTNLKITHLDKDRKSIRYDVKYTNDDELAVKFALRLTTEVSITVLKIFREIFKTRFEIADLASKIDAL